MLQTLRTIRIPSGASARNFSKVGQHRPNQSLKDNRPIIVKQRQINQNHDQIASALGLPWRLVGAT